MNAMGHKVKNFIGVRQSALWRRRLERAAPTAMAMGTDGMADDGARWRCRFPPTRCR